MRAFKVRRLSAVAIVSLTATGAIAATALAGGGLSVSPGILEHVAKAGGVGSMQISNTSSASMAISVAARPWLQAHNGEVSANRRGTLREVRLGATSFTLAAGASRSVPVALSRNPSGRSLYGALEVTGTPSRRSGNGVTLAYRVISSLRLDPPSGTQSYRVQAGGLIEQGTIGHGTLLLAVRNTGNTIVPIGGKARIAGSGHTVSTSIVAKAIVPGATVNVPLAQLPSSLRRGRYTVVASLAQGGHGLGAVRRTVNLR